MRGRRPFFFRRKFLIISCLLASAATVAVAAAALMVPQLNWRAKVVFLRATGRMHDVTWGDLLVFLLPGPEAQDMATTGDRRDPYTMIVNKRTTARDLQKGAHLFEGGCAECHGRDGRGGPGGPSLAGREFAHGGSDWAIYRTIRYGVAETAMPPHPISSTEIWQLVAHIRALGGANPSAPDEAPEATRAAGVNVPYQDIASAGEPSSDWLTYSGAYSGQRHSALTAITPANVNQLAVRWIHQYQGTPARIETSPIVRNGIMYITVMNYYVLALDAASGKVTWTFERKKSDMPDDVAGAWNRGLAILDDKVFLGTADAKLVALSAATGHLIWQAEVAGADQNYEINGAPLAYRNLVVTGITTLDPLKTAQRGFIAAYDAKTGKECWRFYTVPGLHQPGNDSWSGDSWRSGGALTWMTGSYDPNEDLLYWGVGNPMPDYDAAARVGDDLYSESVVALHGTTGKLAWYFQFTPADDHDWDATEIPILADRRTDAGIEKQLLFANRNGFYYVMDRVTGKFIKATAFVQQNWTAGIDANGRPLPRPAASATTGGLLVYPGNGGATNWWSPSFDPALDVVFVPAVERAAYFYPEGKYPNDSGTQSYTAVRALNASDGTLAWEYRSKPTLADGNIGSLLSTRSGLVFGSYRSTFFALAAATGRLLWSVETGGNISSSPVTYSVDGEQFVAISAGRDLLAFALPRPN